jgi:hypothetical protein
MVSLEMLKFFNEIIILAQFGSGQLPFLGLAKRRPSKRVAERVALD